MKDTMYQRVTDSIVKAMEGGKLPWQSEWATASLLPTNHTTGRRYQGINVLSLWIAQTTNGFTTNRWMTYKQAQSLGAQVRKGETSTTGIFFKPMTKIDDQGEERQFAMARAFNLFNLDQIDGVEWEQQPTQEHEPDDVANATRIAAALNVPIDAGQPCYIPSKDTILMPALNTFSSTEAYMSVLAHECVHATGASHRLDRKIKNKFGNADYAYEELVAELGAAFISAEWGFNYRLEQHASYIQSWLKALKDDNKLVFTAAAQAEKAVQYIERELMAHSLVQQHESELGRLIA